MRRMIFQALLFVLFCQAAFAQTELVTNGNFASGSAGWTLSGNFYADSRFSSCRSCPGYAYVSNSDGTPGNNLVGYMYQTITVPSNASSASLTFWYYITTQEVGSTPYDVLNVTIQTSSGSYLATVATLSNANATSSYVQSAAFSLLPFRGQTIRINFFATTDASLPTTFRVDDVSATVVSCSYSISPTSQSFGSSGGTGSVSVTAGSGCSWTATSNASWITITSGSSGSGNGTVNYSVASNSSTSSRSGTMTIAGQTFTVNQSGESCTYSISPTSQSFTSSGGTGSVSVTAGSGCSWTATSNASWITITSGSSGSGNGTVNYSVAANSSTSSRTGTMTIAGLTFSISQDGTGTTGTISLTKLWSDSDFWKPETYLPNHGGSGLYNAVDFYYTTRNRPDLYRYESGVQGKQILAPHSGRVFLHLLDVSSESGGNFTSIDANRVIQGLDSPPRNSFSFYDGTRTRKVDLELVIDASEYRTIYVHLQIADVFFNSTVLQKIRNAVSTFLNNQAYTPPGSNFPRVAIDAGQTVVTGTVIGATNHWGLATTGNYHLHFQVHPVRTGYSESYPVLGSPADLSDGNQVTLSGQVILDTRLLTDVSGVYRYPAMPRRTFPVSSFVVTNTNWDGVGAVNFRSSPGGNVITQVPHGLSGQVVSGPQVAQITVPTPSTWHVWWQVQFSGYGTGWIAAEYIDASTGPTINISVSPASINFGNVAVGQSRDTTVTITNQSSSTGTLTGNVTISGTDFSINNGGGSYSLSPGQSRTVTVRFSPSAAASRSGTLSIEHNATNQTSPMNVSLSGTGTAVINISVSPASINFGNVAVGQSRDTTVTITNQSSSTGTLTGNVTISGTDFSIISGAGSYSLSPGQSRTVTVRFSPSAATSRSGTLSIEHNATNQTSPMNVSLSGTGTAVINISVSPASINFGNVAVGQSRDTTVTITNQSSSTGTLTGNVTISGTDFSIINGGGSYSLSPGQSRTVTVRFSPSAATSRSGTLSIEHNATNQTSPMNVSLSGTGTAVINISVSPASINFGNVAVGQSRDTTVTITNQSSSTGTLTGNVTISGTDFSIFSGAGSYSLSPGQSRTVSVRFSPSAATSRSGTLSIEHNATNQTSPMNVSLSGTGTAVVNISVSPASINFGNVAVGQSRDTTVTITNQSSSTGTLTGNVTISGTDFSIISGAGSYSLSPGQSRTVTVRFSPSAATSRSGTLSIEHNATNQSSPMNVSLSGTGTAVINISVSPASINFGNVAVGQSRDTTVTITNQSSSTGTLTGNVTISGTDFSIINGGGSYSLSPGQSRTVTVRFSPSAATSRSGTLSIEHNATNQSSPMNVSLSGTGTAVINISVSPASINFGNVAVGQSRDTTVTITNQSSSTGTLTDTTTISGTDFSIISGGGSYSLSPGQSRTVRVRFSPTQTISRSGILTIRHNATSQASPTNVDLSGTGISSIPWSYRGNTSVNASIAVPSAINPRIGTQPLQTGDAIGVFFLRNDSLICAGYSIWQVGQNMAITAWGDDPQTTIKDGFAEGELIRYKIWGVTAQREYNAAVTYQTGGPTFTANGIYVLSSLVGITTQSHHVTLRQGWNMISSHIQPSDSTLDSMFVRVRQRMVIMKNGAGEVYWPAFGINTIGRWNFRHGYQIYMQAADTLTIAGQQVVPEQTPVQLIQGWHLMAYLRNSPLGIDTALSTITAQLVIAKNNAGQVYWPVFGINTIGSMIPGQGYQVYLTQAATLTYPANTSQSSGQALAKRTSDGVGSRFKAPQYYRVPITETGSNAILLIEGAELNDGDEIGVWTQDRRLIGSGVVANRRALITIWGDNSITEDVKEGANEKEVLSLTHWSAADRRERTLTLNAVTDALTSQAAEPILRYRTDAVWIAQARTEAELPSVFSLEQNYPNPFNPSTVIRYSLPHDGHVRLEVFNVLGQRVVLLVDQEQKAGYYQVQLENIDLPSGVYFYRIEAAGGKITFRQTKKMLIVR